MFVAFAHIISRLEVILERGCAVLHEADSVDWIVLVLRAVQQPCNGRAAGPYCLLPFHERITDASDLDGSVYCASNEESFFRCLPLQNCPVRQCEPASLMIRNYG